MSGSSASPMRSVVWAWTRRLKRQQQRRRGNGQTQDLHGLLSIVQIRRPPALRSTISTPARPAPSARPLKAATSRSSAGEKPPSAGTIGVRRRQFRRAVTGGRMSRRRRRAVAAASTRQRSIDIGAAGMEAAARRRIERARHLALQHDAAALGPRLGHRDRRQQRAAVGVARRGEQRLGVRGLDDAAEIHHGDAVGDVLHHGEIVRDEDVGEAEPVLQVAQQIEDLRADRDVERRDRLVADDELRLDRERARDRDALALAAGEFVRIAAREARLQPDQAQQFARPARAGAAAGTRSCSASGSVRIWLTVMRGLSEA